VNNCGCCLTRAGLLKAINVVECEGQIRNDGWCLVICIEEIEMHLITSHFERSNNPSTLRGVHPIVLSNELWSTHPEPTMSKDVPDVCIVVIVPDCGDTTIHTAATQIPNIRIIDFFRSSTWAHTTQIVRPHVSLVEVQDCTVGTDLLQQAMGSLTLRILIHWIQMTFNAVTVQLK
jgi:hypothetical protein